MGSEYYSNQLCLHQEYCNQLKDLSDKEIKTTYSEERQESKPYRFCLQYGGSAYTIHKNNGVPMLRANEIENGFKELHKGIYTWGEEKLKLAMRTGYVESVAGFKLYLSQFDIFQELQVWYKTLDNEFWNSYSEGKKASQKYYNYRDKLIKQEITTEEEKMKLQDLGIKANSYTLYKQARPKVSKYAKLKSEYFKICLNNPAQSMAAFQTKSALIELFKTIVKRGDLWKARISNSPYDEILMEVKEDLEKDYITIMEKCMIEEGNKWLKSGLFEMECDAISGLSWGHCH